MVDITFNNWQTFHSVPNEVAEYLQAQDRQILALQGAIREFRMKKRTARDHPTKDTKIQSWRAERDMYAMLPDKIEQSDLFAA